MATEYVERKVEGPRVARFTADKAREALVSHPSFPKQARGITLAEENGSWVATFLVPKVAGPFPPGGGDEEPGGPPTEEGPPEPEAEAPDEGGEEGEKKPPKKDGEDGKPGEPKLDHGKPSVEDAVAALTMLVTAIADKLGIHPGGPDDSPVPGPDAGLDGPPGPPGGPPAPHGGPPGGPEAPGRPVKVRPGEGVVQPGQLPIGTPAFSSVQPQVPPFPEIGRVASFRVENEDTGQTIAQVISELAPVVNPWGYRVGPVKREGGLIKAVISAHA